MCLCMDANSPTFHAVTYPRARKSHLCVECWQDIQPGSKYQRVSGKWDGYVDSYTTCLDCKGWREAHREAEKQKDPQEFCVAPYGSLWECIYLFTEEHLDYHPDGPFGDEDLT